MTGFPGERLAKRARVICQVGKDVDFPYVVRVIERTGLDRRRLNTISREVPICRPLEPIANTEWKAAGPAADAGKLPAANHGIERLVCVSSEGPVSSKWQIRHPIRCDLMGGVKIGDATELVRAPGILDLSPISTDCAHALRVGSKVD